MDYPQREAYFAMRFIRLLTKSAAAMQIGSDGVLLLVIVAGQEDACRYTRPVNFWNTQLATLIGLRGSDEHALRRVRERCIKAGWLKYLPGNKQQPASYYVTIPAAVTALSDGVSDESPHEYSGDDAAITAQTRQESGKKAAGIRQESGRNPAPSSPFPIPNPIPGEQAHERPPEQKLATWIRWTSNDADRQETNRQELRQLVEQHGMKAVQAKAEQLAHAAGTKVFPNALSDAFLASGKPDLRPSDTWVPPVLNLKPRALL